MDTNIIPGNGKSPNQVRAFRLIWEGIPVYIKWTPDKHPGIIAHLEVQSENRVPLPITETGYKSHFCQREEVEQYDSPLAYVRAWLDHACQSPDWKAYLQEQSKPALF